MSRKSKTKVIPLPIFDVADGAIRRMQTAVMYHTVKDFPVSRQEFLECMIAPNILSLLREVRRYTIQVTMQAYQTFLLSRCQFNDGSGIKRAMEVTVFYDHTALGIAPPRTDMPPNTLAPRWSEANELFRDLADVYEKWANVWEVKEGLNRLGSMSKAKDLIPSFRNLMPADSPFHFVVPKTPTPSELSDAGLTATMLREAVSTITEGILANPDQTIPGWNVISVTVAVTDGGRKLPCGLF